MTPNEKDPGGQDTHNVTAFVESREGVCGGVELVKESRVPVWKVVRSHLKGLSIGEILEDHSELTEEDVRGAISYYYCHRRRIERQMSEHE